MSVLVKQAGIISAADFIRLLVKTVIGIVLARVLTQTDYGTYRQLFLIYSLLFSVFMIGLPQSVYYFIPRSDNEEKKRFLRQTLDIFTLLGLVSSVMLIAFRSSTGVVFNNPNLPQALLIFAFYPFFTFVSQLYYFAMIGLQQVRKAAQFVIFSVICDVFLVLGAVLVTHNLKYIVLGLVASVILQWVYARIKLNPYCSSGKSFLFNRQLLKEQLAYSLPIGISTIIGVVSAQLDKLLISSYFTPEQFAVFAVGAAELPFITILTNSVNAVIIPEMNKQNNQKAVTDLYRGAVRKNALLLFPLFALCFLFAPHIIQILYSDKYSAAAVFFRIYLLSMPLRIATYSIMFQVYNKTKYIFSITGITLLANVAFSLALIKLIGINGPAVSSVVVTYVSVILYLILIKTKLQIRLKDLFPIPALLRTMLAAVCTGISVYPILKLKLPVFWQFLTGAVLFICIYYMFGNLFKAIQSYDNRLLKSLLISVGDRIKRTLPHA